MRSPLKNKRILVTRPRHQAGRLAEQLVLRGAIPVLLPTTEIADPENFGCLDCALSRLEEFDWVVFTSVNGVEAVARRMKTLEIPFERISTRKIAVVGPMTAESVANFWRQPDAMPANYIADEIASAMGDLPGQRILLARGDLARPELPDELARRGATVLDITAYRVVRTTDPTALSEADRPDVITMSSGEAARVAIGRLKESGFEQWLQEVPIACIGPHTATAVTDEGFGVATVAEEHTIPGLIKAVEELFAVRSSLA
ncbi:MAG TPA: uroporphyrinogen-III synthase [Fimbriimonas sp.]|nr:uroporphyrinogen-III synthase [Fimbriimonas sp.]